MNRRRESRCAAAQSHLACLALMATRLAGKQSLLQSLWSAYSRSLETSPILTKGLTSTAGFIVGDVIAQVRSLIWYAVRAAAPLQSITQQQGFVAGDHPTSTAVGRLEDSQIWSFWPVDSRPAMPLPVPLAG